MHKSWRVIRILIILLLNELFPIQIIYNQAYWDSGNMPYSTILKYSKKNSKPSHSMSNREKITLEFYSILKIIEQIHGILQPIH